MSSIWQCFDRKCITLLLLVFLSMNTQAVVGGSELWHSENFALGFNFFEQLNRLTNLENVDAECLAQLGIVRDAVKSNEIWALKMLDAWARVPSGILYGHLMEMGNFEECLDISAPLFGKYCQASIPFESSSSGVSVQLQLGTCVPNKCNTADIDMLLKEILENSYNLSLNATTNLLMPSTCSTSELVELEPLDWVAIGLFILLAVLMTLSTCYDCFFHTKEWEQTLFSMIEQSGSIAVDTFFFLSGLLVIMVAFREMAKNTGKLNVPMMYIHRYLRLTPVLAVAILIYMSLFNYIGNGPIWKSFTVANKMCDKTWWETLFYVQNYAAAGKMCLGHTWYLAVDTQLFFLSPIFLITIWKWKKFGIAATIIFGLLLVACLFTIVMINQYTIYDIARNYGAASDAMPKIYYSTHTRCSTWIVGLIFGYYLHRNNGNVAKLPNWLVIVCWLVSLITAFAIVFAWYPRILFSTSGPTVLESAFYLAVGRVAWPLALCWMVYACINGYGGPINVFLSWSLWQPISKLSYSMYIWHLIVITINSSRIKTNTYFSDYDVILSFWSNFSITLLVSICVYLAVEAPIVDIESYLLPRKTAKVSRPQTTPAPAATISQHNLCD